jgi:hypothetical protein
MPLSFNKKLTQAALANEISVRRSTASATIRTQYALKVFANVLTVTTNDNIIIHSHF